MRRTMNLRLAGLLLSLLLITSSVAASAGEWSRFRGPNGTGVSTSKDLPVEFGPEKNVQWATEVPFGRSSPTLAGDRLFLTGIDGDKLVTLAIDRSSGSVLWRGEVERRRVGDIYNATDSATPTPATDGENVFVFFQEAGVISYAADGSERWRVDPGPFRNYYGMSASPVLAGDTLLLLCDQAMGSFILALDKDSGKQLWRQDRPLRMESYTTPILLPVEGEAKQVVVSGSRWLDAYDIATGEIVWTLGGMGSGPVSSPVVAGDTLFVNAPDHAPEPLTPFTEVLGEHDSDDSGDLSREEVEGAWMSQHFGWVDGDGDGSLTSADWKRLNDEMENDNWGLYAVRLPQGDGEPSVLWNYRQSVAYIPTVLVYRDILYMVKDGIVSALDPATGELIKRGRLGEGGVKVQSSPVAADGKIYIATVGGEVAVIEAGKEWKTVALNDIGEELYATPTISDGVLYVRSRGHLYSFREQPSKPKAEAPASR